MINFSSIKTWLYGVLVIVVIPPAVMLLYFTYARNANELLDTQTRVASLARTQAGNTAQLIGEGREMLERMVKRPLIRALDASHCDPILLDTKFWYPYFTNLSVVDATGRVVCSALGLPLEPSLSYRDHEWFPRVLARKAFVVGALRIGGKSDILIMPLAEPIIDDGGSVMGALSLTVDLAHLDLTVPRAFDTATDISIIDSSGNYITRSTAPGARRDWEGRKSGV
jgi:hypothetical protein